MIFRYNGIDLSYVLTQSVTQEPARDPSGTDQLYTRIRIEVRAVLNAGLNPSLGASDTPARQIPRIRHMLTAPRRALYYAAGGSPGGAVIDLPAGRDDHTGPWPDAPALTVTHVTEATYVVTFAVVVCLTDCGTAPPEYLSNRWQESINYDANWHATRRVVGTLITSGRAPGSPDDLRLLVTPGVPPGFRRESADYQLSEDGLTVRYTFADRQLAKVPPFPATTMRGRQVETTPMPGGKRKGEIQLSLTGPPTVNPRDLLGVAIRVAMARAYHVGFTVSEKSGRILVGGSIAESLDDDKNEVSLHLQWDIPPARSRDRGLQEAVLSNTPPGTPGRGSGEPYTVDARSPLTGRPAASTGMFASWVGRPLSGSDPAGSVAPPLRGIGPAAYIRLVAAALKDPCGAELQETTLSTDDNRLVGTSQYANLTVGPLPNPVPDDEDGLFADDDTGGVWEHHELVYHYRDFPGVGVVPPPKEGDDCSFVKLHGSYMALRVELAATRVGTPPVLPPPDGLNDGSLVYVGGVWSPAAADVAADGVSVRYRVSAVYDYVLRSRPTATPRWPRHQQTDLARVRPALAVPDAPMVGAAPAPPAAGTTPLPAPGTPEYEALFRTPRPPAVKTHDPGNGETLPAVPPPDGF